MKNEPFDMSEIMAKRRYEINKGKKNFDVKEIWPEEYKESLYDVTMKAYSAWYEKYCPDVEKEAFLKGVCSWKNSVVFGGFGRETNELCGYAILNEAEWHT